MCDLICNDNCLTCIINQSHCTSCNDEKYVNPSSYVCESTCDINCATCKDITTNCKTCNSGMYLDNITVLDKGVCLVCNPPCAIC